MNDEKVWTNGLSVADNRVLVVSHNPTEIVDQTLKGMRRTIEDSQRGNRVTASTANARTAVSLQNSEVEWDAIRRMVYANDGRPPAVGEQLKLGIRLAQLVLPESIAAEIRKHPDRAVEVFP